MSLPSIFPILAWGHAESGGELCFNGNYDAGRKRWIFTSHYLWASALGGTLGRGYGEDEEDDDDNDNDNDNDDEEAVVQLVEYPDLSVALSKCPLWVMADAWLAPHLGESSTYIWGGGDESHDDDDDKNVFFPQRRPSAELQLSVCLKYNWLVKPEFKKTVESYCWSQSIRPPKEVLSFRIKSYWRTNIPVIVWAYHVNMSPWSIHNWKNVGTQVPRKNQASWHLN